MTKEISRRDFLKLAGAAGIGATLAACGVKPEEMPDTISPTSTPNENKIDINPTVESTPVLDIPHIEELSGDDPLVCKVVVQAMQQLDFGLDEESLKFLKENQDTICTLEEVSELGKEDDNSNLSGVPRMNIIGFNVETSTNEDHPFIMVGDKSNDSLYVAYGKSGDVLAPVDQGDKIVFEQLFQYDLGEDRGIAVGRSGPGGEGILLPAVFSLKDNEVTFTDPWSLDQILIQNEGVGKKVLSSVTEIKDEWFEKVTENHIGRNGITEYMLGGKILQEKNHRFLVNQEGKKVGILEKNREWGEYLDVEVVNFYENPDMKIEDVPTITLDDLKNGRWTRRLRLEMENMDLDKQNVNTDLISYNLNDRGPWDVVTLEVIGAEKLNIDQETKNLKSYNKRPIVNLFPVLLQINSEETISIVTQRFPQKDNEKPYSLLNIARWERPNKLDGFVEKYLPGGQYADYVFLPMTKLEDQGMTVEVAKKVGLYDFFWNSELYGPEGKSTEIFNSLTKEGVFPEDSEFYVYAQGDFIKAKK